MAGSEETVAPGLARVALEADGVEGIDRLIASGEFKQAIEWAARSYAASLGRLCMAFTGSQAESEELVQETLLAAHDAFPQYRGEGSVRAWLFGIARRLCARHLEMRTRREAKLRLVIDTTTTADTTDLVLERERARRARAALGKLKPTEREAVVMRYEAGLSFREVAAACGVDEATARKRVSRALLRLRAELEKE